MRVLSRWIITCSYLIAVNAAPSPVDSAPAPLSTACGDIVNSCNISFTAKQAYDCLVSVPFNPAVASRLISGYLTDTVQYQSTLAYLKDPPPGYQQPAVDILAGLRQIQTKIDQDQFPNQYAFEATLQNLLYSAHDAHFQLNAGILSAFTFSSPIPLVALSVDGVQIPKVYNAVDILFQLDSDGSFTASAIKTINGQDVNSYLKQLAAANSPGNLEPNADWNDLFSSSAVDIQGDYSILEADIEFYPGETITLGFENGTTLGPIPWMATYNSPGPTGPLSTGGDFYNFFVLGFYPASYDPAAPEPCGGNLFSTNTTINSTSTSSIPTATATSWPDSAYPSTPDVHQPNLYPDGGGFLTGYFLENISTGVLSIPTFEMYGDDIQTFSDTVQDFLTKSRQAGMQKILIDLQQNLGGDSLLGVDTFKHFFPDKDGFRGGRLRAHVQADIIGNTFTALFDTNTTLNATIRDALSASEWVATARIDTETGQNFTSWAQFFGPQTSNGDNFTIVQRENISNPIYDENALGIDIYAAARPAASGQLYDAEDITLLTDGLCSSACAVFVELMHYEQGVKSVVVGGLPQTGPMQIASGTRGQLLYAAQDIDDDISIVGYVNKTAAEYLPDRDTDYFISYLGVNLRDQVRKDQNVPLQFVYDAADCRIFYTAQTWSDYSSLWTNAVKAIADPQQFCVTGSTGYAVVSTSQIVVTPPPAPQLSDYNASATYGTNNQFTSVFKGPKQGVSTRTLQGDPVPNAQVCNDFGQTCADGRKCIFNTSKPTPCNVGGRARTCMTGKCPSTTLRVGLDGQVNRLGDPATHRSDGANVKSPPTSNPIFRKRVVSAVHSRVGRTG